MLPHSKTAITKTKAVEPEPLKARAEPPQRHFPKEDTQTVTSTGKMPNIANHQENTNQNHERYHLTLVRMAAIRKRR